MGAHERLRAVRIPAGVKREKGQPKRAREGQGRLRGVRIPAGVKGEIGHD